jgi:wyosine [tRNA(Phe)-imidazoG37] synthetase (radical SAM superfamily)
MALPSFPVGLDIVYGPFPSRRLGASLGVNLLPSGVKVCAFNCNYCQCGWTFDLTDDATLAKWRWPTATEVGEALGRRLSELAAAGTKVDAITFAGNGEPTLHPDFARAVEVVLGVRDRSAKGVPVHALSNGATLQAPGVADALNLLDERHIKLDAGSESMFLEMNSPTTDIGIWDVMRGMRGLTDFVVQAMFTRGRRDNSVPEEVDMWIEAVRKIKPKRVDVYSLSLEPADAQIFGVPPERLREIAALCQKRTGIPSEAY